jgi:hypothetical protein
MPKDTILNLFQKITITPMQETNFVTIQALHKPLNYTTKR